MTLTHFRLKQMLQYCPESGLFRWRCSPTNGVKAGSIAGNLNPDNSRWYINLDSHSYLANRLAWFYMLAVWPDQDVDHINGIRLDNKWSNLRLATRSINLQNQRRARCDNKTGFLGVHWSKKEKRFVANIKVGPKRIYLGGYATAKEASVAYLTAKRQLHEGCTI